MLRTYSSNLLFDLEARKKFSLSMRKEQRSAISYDAKGSLCEDRCVDIRCVYDMCGAVHVRHTGILRVEDLTPWLEHLGFSKERQFFLGGRTSAAKQKKWVNPSLRRMDFYPPELYLLPNNEVQYQRFSPRDVLFLCVSPSKEGGRTFVHSAKKVEQFLRMNGGEELLSKFRRYGLTIETGFLDAHHPMKSINYFSSWQERFQTEDPDLAMQNAMSKLHEYDECWWKEEGQYRTLMTKITLSAFKKLGSESYLRFPRIALGEPTLQNGYRAYPLGNGEELRAQEKALLFAAYDATKEGADWQEGDLILFDNIRYGHSRESFSGKRSVFVGMAGMVWDDQCKKLPIKEKPTKIHTFRCDSSKGFLYRQPILEIQKQDYGMRIFDAKGKFNPRTIESIRTEFANHGVLHIINTGLECKHPGQIPNHILDELGFGQDVQFKWGGKSSGRTSRTHFGNGVYSTDYYPPNLFLLPHNEILYQRHMPTKLLFFSTKSSNKGGRTLVHSSRDVEAFLRRSGKGGAQLVQKLYRYGFRIDSGFLDRDDPNKQYNYFRSWQDRFQTEDREEAYRLSLESNGQFDDCWWKSDFPGGEAHPVFMTRVHIPAVISYDREKYLLFPRIALDKPSISNGFRRFSFGNGEELTAEEIDILISAYLYTAQGKQMLSNDILLVDNIRYGHSREMFEGDREVGVVMAGSIWNRGVRIAGQTDI